MFVKSLETGRFGNIEVAIFTISNSDSLEVNLPISARRQINFIFEGRFLIIFLIEKFYTLEFSPFMKYSIINYSVNFILNPVHDLF